jgi:5-methylcytosine-specific restriction enzyme subunit McrC
MTPLVVREYATLSQGPVARLVDGSLLRAEVPPQAFAALRGLLLDPDTSDQAQAVLTAGVQGGRDVLKLSSWVGVLQTPDGTQIEILPKVLENDADVVRTRQVFIRMLGALLGFSAREWQAADLDASELPLMEFFAAQVLTAVARLVRQGVARTYVERPQELPALRGRLDLPRHLTLQVARPAMLAVVADEFLPDRPENRAIRAALEVIQPLVRSPANVRLHKRLRTVFGDVPVSRNPLQDLRMWQRERSYRHYAAVRPLVQLVLLGQSPLAAQGKAHVHSLLFPMADVFEAYVAQALRQSTDENGHHLYTKVETQLTDHHLASQGDRKVYLLKPDLRLTLPDGQVVLADTKWKRLNASGPRGGVDMRDLYQMYAYGQKYLQGKGEVWLIYPKTATFTASLAAFKFNKCLRATAVPFDLEADFLKGTALIHPLQ